MLVNKANEDVIALGRDLHAIRADGDFEAYCRDLPIHYRKARIVMVLSEAVDSGLLSEKAVTEIGWTKASVIVTATKSKNKVEQAVKFARTNTVPALRRYLAGEGKQELVTKAFTLSRSDAAELDRVLLHNGARKRGRAILNREEALLSIVRKCANTAHA